MLVSKSGLEYEIATAAVEEHGAIQRPAELAELLVLVSALQPRSIVELGVNVGGTLWAFSEICPAAQLIAVDNQQDGVEARRDHRDLATFVLGNTHSVKTKKQICALLDDGQADVIFLDADHSYRATTMDWRDYSPMVRPGGLFAFHDIEPNPHPGFGSHLVWQEIRNTGRPTIEIVARDDGMSQCGIGVVRL